MRFFVILCSVLVLMSSFVVAGETYKPYLHKASVPDHPEVRLFGQYATDLFPGAGTYSFDLEVPPGTAGLSPEIVFAYNSQSARSRPTVLGAGWQVVQDLIYRDTNGTFSDPSDDEYIMTVDKKPYQLHYHEGDQRWHTEVEYYFKIENLTGADNTNGTYWRVTKKDGTQYYFGLTYDSEYVSNLGIEYVTKWHLNEVRDTHGNSIHYTYRENPFPSDEGSSYLWSISYNSDRLRNITFEYEPIPKLRRTYENGGVVRMSHRMSAVNVMYDNSLIRRYDLSYAELGPASFSLSGISQLGSDNVTELYDVAFSYHEPTPGFTNDNASWNTPSIAPFIDVNNDSGVRPIDVNNDGYVDLIKEDSIVNKVWYNMRNGSWELNTSWTVPVNITSEFADTGVRFADVNKDGFVDILKGHGEVRGVYINTGTGWTLDSSFELDFEFALESGWPRGTRIADVNGDGYPDFVNGTSGTGHENVVYFSNQSGWQKSSWATPEHFMNSTHVDTGLRLLDVNGDGLVDLLQATEDERSIWINTGYEWSLSNEWDFPTFVINRSGGDIGTRFTDLNGDGLVDALLNDEAAYLNNGSGWTRNDAWRSPEAFTYAQVKDKARRIIDVDGNGIGDIVIAWDENIRGFYGSNAKTPYVLKTISHAYGSETAIQYTHSTQYDNTLDGISKIGFPILVVSNVSTDTGMSGAFNVTAFTSYEYAGAQYNYDDREFRGFNEVTEEDEDTITKHYFYQDDPRRGKEYTTEVYDKSNSLYFKNVKEYDYTLSEGAYNVSLVYSTDYVYDGENDPLVTNTSYQYGQYDNVLNITYHGDVSVSGDERHVEYNYATNEDIWVVSAVSRKTTMDSDRNRVQETKYFYDGLGKDVVGQFGDLTRIEEWNKVGNSSFTRYTYDEYGNVATKTDPRGGVERYYYDDSHTFRLRSVNALGHVTVATYDVGLGVMTSETQNGITTTFVYDQFGRISKEVLPYDSVTLPTKRYSYYFDGSAPEAIRVESKSTGYDNVTYFYDGFGNLVQLKSGVDNNKSITKNIYYDSQYRVDEEDVPYFETYTDGISVPSSVDSTTYAYDTMDRVTQVVNPDGTNKTVVFDRSNITDYDENGHAHSYVLDGHGNIVTVVEYNNNTKGEDETYYTTYAYDPVDNLVLITDTLGNEFHFDYDTFGRKINTLDPDLGQWNYTYDASGNLILQRDNRGQTINLTYDALNRVLTKDSGDKFISFTYDSDYAGTLSTITSENSSFSYTYDDRLRVLSETQTLFGESFTTEYVYDSANRVISTGDLDFFFNKQGLVRKISDYVTTASYNAFGSLTSRTFGNSIVTSYTYDTMNRLSTIDSSVQDLTYGYDNVGNILTIHDAVQNRNHAMTYDKLDRLIGATIGTDVYSYKYNAIGNILHKQRNNHSINMFYNSLAHAPDEVFDSASVDIVDSYEYPSTSKNRTLEFRVVNEMGTPTAGVNWSVDFDDGSIDSNQVSVINTSMWVFIEHNYSSGGEYGINISAGGNDKEIMDTTFGLRSFGLSEVDDDVSERSFEMVVNDGIVEDITNVAWNCTDGSSGNEGTLSSGESATIQVTHNYTSSGTHTFRCDVTSNDGTVSEDISVEVDGLEVEDYTVLRQNLSERVVEFTVENGMSPLDSSVSVVTPDESFNLGVNLSDDSSLMVFAAVNYSSDADQQISIVADSTGSIDTYGDSTTIRGGAIENYVSLASGSGRVLMFDVYNNWLSGVITWSLSEPALTKYHSLDANESVMVFVENAYTGGEQLVTVNASAADYVDSVVDRFSSTGLVLDWFDVLNIGSSYTFETRVTNGIYSKQNISWVLDADPTVFNSTLDLELDSSLFIFVEETYSPDTIHRATMTVNSSLYTVSEDEVVIV